MAIDYYPLIARSVAGLEPNTVEARRALYERARTVQLTHLRRITPALDIADVTRETNALEQAIHKVEAEALRCAAESSEEWPPCELEPRSSKRREAGLARPQRTGIERRGASLPIGLETTSPEFSINLDTLGNRLDALETGLYVIRAALIVFFVNFVLDLAKLALLSFPAGPLGEFTGIYLMAFFATFSFARRFIVLPTSNMRSVAWSYVVILAMIGYLTYPSFIKYLRHIPDFPSFWSITQFLLPAISVCVVISLRHGLHASLNLRVGERLALTPGLPGGFGHFAFYGRLFGVPTVLPATRSPQIFTRIVFILGTALTSFGMAQLLFAPAGLRGYFSAAMGDCSQPSLDQGCLEGWAWWVLPLLFAAVGANMFVGNWITRWARSRVRFSFNRLRKLDSRPPILFLRSFSDDQVRLKRSYHTLLSRLVTIGNGADTLDRVMIEDYSMYGPVVALGRPNENKSPYGAARAYVDGSIWQETVERIAKEAAAIVFCFDQTPGVHWELNLLKQPELQKKTIYLMSPKFSEEERHSLWHSSGLFSKEAEKNIFAWFYDGNGVKQACVSTRFDRSAYVLATRVFFRSRFDQPVQNSVSSRSSIRPEALPPSVRVIAILLIIQSLMRIGFLAYSLATMPTLLATRDFTTTIPLVTVVLAIAGIIAASLALRRFSVARILGLIVCTFDLSLQIPIIISTIHVLTLPSIKVLWSWQLAIGPVYIAFYLIALIIFARWHLRALAFD